MSESARDILDHLERLDSHLLHLTGESGRTIPEDIAEQISALRSRAFTLMMQGVLS